MLAWDATGSNHPSTVVRDAGPADYEVLLSMWRELMDLHVELDPRFALAGHADKRFKSYVDTAMSRKDYRVRLAELEGRPAGFSVACVLPNSPVYETRWIGYINDLCVTRSMRRMGVGRLLVNDAVSWLRKNGAESVEVYVADHNREALAFWHGMGGQPYLHRLSLDIHGSPGRDE